MLLTCACCDATFDHPEGKSGRLPLYCSPPCGSLVRAERRKAKAADRHAQVVADAQAVRSRMRARLYGEQAA
jgi:hypothetical protein